MTSPDLTGRTVVITGAGRGLGLAMAQRVGRAGARVVLAERDAERGKAAETALRAEGLSAEFVTMDVADEMSVSVAVEQVATAGPIHGLINNAGLADGVGGKLFQEITVAEWDRIMAVNARGPWLVSRAVLPHLVDGG